MIKVSNETVNLRLETQIQQTRYKNDDKTSNKGYKEGNMSSRKAIGRGSSTNRFADEKSTNKEK